MPLGEIRTRVAGGKIVDVGDSAKRTAIIEPHRCNEHTVVPLQPVHRSTVVKADHMSIRVVTVPVAISKCTSEQASHPPVCHHPFPIRSTFVSLVRSPGSFVGARGGKEERRARPSVLSGE